MKEKIYRTLNELGVPFGICGRDYIEYAVELILKNGRMEITKELYPRVAKTFDAKPLNVERGIRHAVEYVFSNGETKRIEDFFGNTVSLKNGKLTNSDFLYGIVKRIQIYG